jgi:Protein of unknown function (DUF3047)
VSDAEQAPAPRRRAGGALHALVVAARRYAQARGGRPAAGAGAAGLEPAAFLDAWAALLAKAPPGLVRRHALVSVPVDRPPWTDTGLDLEGGDSVSVFGAGRAWLSKPLDLWVGPQFQLWARVGETGPIFNGPRDAHSFVAERPGRLYLGSQFPGQWADPSGRVQTELGAYRGTAGGLAAAVLVWSEGALEAGLDALAAAGDAFGQAAAERERLRARITPPADWHYLWFLGRSEIYRAAEIDGRRAIACQTEGSVGILQKEVALAFEPGTRLRWSWRVDALPSELPEDTPLSHDYLSLAVEFSDGRDLTYYWSRELPSGTSYWCPLPTWKDREHHLVVRSGRTGLGAWQREERDLYADHAARMGPPPERIVRVWLIANSLFQRRPGRCWYADIELVQPGGAVRIA